MKLQDIGFYTLSDERCENLSMTSPMMRCEMILTERCNFNCPYCRGLREDCQGDMPIVTALSVLEQWCDQGLQNIRFSGGEPLIYPYLETLVTYAKRSRVKRIAVSSNGSFKHEQYHRLWYLGVNDFSISLDACCASECGKMAGLDGSPLKRIEENIRKLSAKTYVTVGVVLTDDNAPDLAKIVKYAYDLDVSDIRIIPAAQNGCMIEGVEAIPQHILDVYPILAYRVKNIKEGRPVRSIQEYDSPRCYMPIDDSVVAGDYHFPCVIYMREQGEPIGRIGPNMRTERTIWSLAHDTANDPICKANCLDVCVDHNNKCAACRKEYHGAM
jgi:molybdenum cofactor biosynthesis enzyme MoaA